MSLYWKGGRIMEKVTVIGAGLAGSEACYQLVKRGIQVDLYEMRSKKMTPAHHTGNFAELVCTNSLRSNDIASGVGLLKEEMRRIDSLIMKFADENQVPAGSALAVDRERFSQGITNFLKNHPLVNVIEEEITTLPEGPVIIATGPLTSDALSAEISKLVNKESLYFYDAAAPIIEKDSIDFSKAYYKSRYDKGDGKDYINCAMNKEEFDLFYNELINAEVVKLKEFEKEIYFEGCMPFEEMAKRGYQTLLFGPMKPVGLEKDENHKPYAVVQLRQDNVAGSLYNIVGFQTHLAWKEQKRILSLIPGLENCNIVRYGVMHRNTYINSPTCLKATYQFKGRENLFFAGQMTGVEGYVESAASGMLAGINMARYLKGEELIDHEPTFMLAAMANYIANASSNNFQPMNANFGIMTLLNPKVKKRDRKASYGQQGLEQLEKNMDYFK